jgi:hypothetical protein
MITNINTGQPGVYDHRDNALLTGGVPYGGGSAVAGTLFTNKTHEIADTLYWSSSSPDPCFGSSNAAGGCNTPRFDNYIVDPSSVAISGVSPQPVNAKSFLLISAGDDGIYGSKDDIKNWGK